MSRRQEDYWQTAPFPSCRMMTRPLPLRLVEYNYSVPGNKRLSKQFTCLRPFPAILQRWRKTEMGISGYLQPMDYSGLIRRMKYSCILIGLMAWETICLLRLHHTC